VTLTAREREVILLVAQGHGMREIAARLGITEHTARKHRDNAVAAAGKGSQTATALLVSRDTDTATA
jgi:two-component system nitrate/nitrite response regulator NarL